MLEFAFALPFLLLIVVTIIYFGRVFYIKQIVLSAAQQAARAASRIPNASANKELYIDPIIAAALFNARLISDNTLPAWVQTQVTTPANLSGAVAVQVSYPFVFVPSPNQPNQPASEFDATSFGVYAGDASTTGGSSSVPFYNFTIAEKAVALSEVYQSIQ